MSHLEQCHTKYFLDHFESTTFMTKTIRDLSVGYQNSYNESTKTFCKFCQNEFWTFKKFNYHMKMQHASYVEVSKYFIPNNNHRTIVLCLFLDNFILRKFQVEN